MSITNFHKIILSSLPLFLLLLPFLVIPGMYNPYEFPKYIFLLIFIQIFVVIRALFCLTTKKPLVHMNRFSLLVILFLILLGLANISGLDPHISFLGSMYRHQGFVLWLALGILFLFLSGLNTTEKQEMFQRFATYSVWFLLVLCSYSILQGILFFQFHDYSIPTNYGRIVATFGNPNSLAAYIVMLFPLAFYGTMLLKLSPRNRILLTIILSIFVLITLLLTDSKSALFALIVISSLFFYKSRSSMLMLLIPLVPLILLVLFHTTRLSPWDNRGIIWSYGIQSVIQHPLLGIGQENYELIVDKARHIPIDNAHNIFLELAVAGGIPTLLVFCFIVFLSFRQSIYPIRLSLIAFLICAFFNPLSIPTLATIWFLLALSQTK